MPITDKKTIASAAVLTLITLMIAVKSKNKVNKKRTVCGPSNGLKEE